METILFLNDYNYNDKKKHFFDIIYRNYNNIISNDHNENNYYNQQIKLLVEEGKLCNDKIDHEEINEQLLLSDIKLLLIDYSELDVNQYGKVIGFALASFINRQSGSYCKVDILCGSVRGSGSELLQKITDIIISTGIQKITVDSIKSAERFYLSRGFQIIQQTAYKTKMEKNIRGGSKSKKHKKHKKCKLKKQITYKHKK